MVPIQSESSTSYDARRGMRVLLIEDDVGYANLVRQYLEPAGTFHIKSTRFLQNGLKLLRETPIDALLLDLNLPDSQGIDTFRRVAAAATEAAVLILSSLDDPAYIQEALDRGAQDYLIKSTLDYAQLGQRVHFAVSRQRSLIRQQQEKLNFAQTREVYYRTLLHNVSTPVCLLGKSGAFKNVSPAIESILGYAPSVLEGRLLSDLVHKSEVARLAAFSQQVEDTPGTVLGTTLRVRHRDGTWRVLQMRWRNLLHDPVIRSIVISIHDNTRYREAIQKRQDSETRYQSLFDRSRDAVYLHDMEGNFLDANLAALELLGYSETDVSTLNIMDLLPEEEHPRAMELLAEIREHGQQRELAELHLVRKDGTLIHVEVMSAVVLRQGRPWAIQGIARDATSRFQAQQQQHEQQLLAEGLRETAEKLLSSTLNLYEMFDHILEQVAMLIPCDGATLMLVESGVARVAGVFGYSEDERRQIEQVELQIAEARNLNELDASSEPLVIEDTRKFEGWRDNLLPFLSRIRSYLGAPIHIGDQLLGFINLDSTRAGHFSQRQAHRLMLFCDLAAIALNNARLYERLRISNERLEERVALRTREVRHERDRMQSILDQMGDAVVILDAQGGIRHFNPALLQLAGTSDPEALRQREIAELLTVDEANILRRRLRQVVADGCEHRFQLRWAESAFDVTMSRLEAWSSPQVLCTLHDITEMKNVKARLHQALEKEREINELKSHFTSLVSHEFRTPLSAIGISADLLRRFWDRLPEEKRERQLTSIEKQVQRLGDLVEDVSWANHAEMMGLRFRPVPTNLTNLCRQIVEEGNLTENRGVFVKLTAQNVDNQVTIDPDLFHHIFRNLVSNAVKYSDPSSTVHVDLRQEKSQVTLTVRDQGIGIPEDFRENLFDSFRRGSNVGNRPGTGLGLTIVKRAVDAHGGAVDFTSVAGEGTTFTVTLPIGIDHGHAASGIPAPRSQELALNGHHAL